MDPPNVYSFDRLKDEPKLFCTETLFGDWDAPTLLPAKDAADGFGECELRLAFPLFGEERRVLLDLQAALRKPRSNRQNHGLSVNPQEIQEAKVWSLHSALHRGGTGDFSELLIGGPSDVGRRVDVEESEELVLESGQCDRKRYRLFSSFEFVPADIAEHL